jgi:hypothetical protein
MIFIILNASLFIMNNFMEETKILILYFLSYHIIIGLDKAPSLFCLNNNIYYIVVLSSLYCKFGISELTLAILSLKYKAFLSFFYE